MSEAKQIHYHQLDYVFAARFMTFYRKSSLLFLKWYCLNALDLLLPVWWSCFYNDILCLSFDAAQIILLNRSFLNDPGLLSSSINPSQMILLYCICLTKYVLLILIRWYYFDDFLYILLLLFCSFNPACMNLNNCHCLFHPT